MESIISEDAIVNARKVLLLSCRSPFLDDSKIYSPMGNLYLKSFLNHHLISTQVVLGDDDYDLEHPEKFEEYDLIGISIMTPQREEASKLLKKIKQYAPHTKVVAGGPHCKYYLDDVMKEPYDFIVPLDGERALLQIASGQGTDRVVWDVMNVKDILAQPRPDRTSANAQKIIKKYHYKLGDKEATTMMTARGCPEKCTFCFDGNTRIMTPEKWKLIKELKEGDTVLTFNEKIGKVEDGIIKKTFRRKANKLLKIWLGTRKYILVTPEHPFYQYGKWVKAENLKVGDILHRIYSGKMKESKLNYRNCKLGDKNPMKRKEIIERANSKENYDKRRKSGFGVVKKKPNKLEQEFTELIKNTKFEFVGNKPILINGYNPDFIHKEKRKIIELFGCYWHNCKEIHNKRNNNRNLEITKKDELRIKMMTDAGYEILIIWEHEINDKISLIKKVWNFETNGVKIHKITEIENETEVYNFECDNNTYFAEGVLVHNCEDAMTVVKWSSIDNLCAEMDDIKSMGYSGVYIFDDLFAIAMPKIKPICEALKKRDLVYRCNGQVRYFTKWGDEFAKLLAGTGCIEMAFGFESGSQKILDNILKRTTVEMNYQAVKYAQEQGIKVKGFVMLGLPGETRETIAETERFIATSGMDDFQLAIYFPYKGTQIRDAIDKGNAQLDMMVVGEGLGAYGQKGGSTESVVRTKELSAEELLSERDRIVKVYQPKSHLQKWQQDHFFDTHLKEGVI